MHISTIRAESGRLLRSARMTGMLNKVRIRCNRTNGSFRNRYMSKTVEFATKITRNLEVILIGNDR
jgi:hypothetical protein